ncbi:hypothetical protein MMC29_007448, partial [Sticta canariensis]|nr:hypothetical protein [Sticta canariensis]
MIQSKQWQRCKSIKNSLPGRTQPVHNQVRRLSNTAPQLRAEEDRPWRRRFKKPRAWSLLSNPWSKSPADDLRYLERFFSPRVKLDSAHTPLVVLLVTPSRLELLNDENTFIPRLLALLFANPKAARWFDVLVTVVDKIPCPTESKVLLGYTNFQGCEGISVLIGKSEELAPDLDLARDRAGERETTAIRQPGVLSFLFKSSAAGLSYTEKKRTGVASFDLTVPVANTIFHNGQTSTLYAGRWISSDSAPGFSCVRKVSLPQQTLHVGLLFPEAPYFPQFNLNPNLTPIGSPRIIAAAMGNIIRQVYAGSGSNLEAAVPASEELEEAVSRHLKTEKDPTQKLEIWALVTPRGCSVTRPRAQPDFPNMISTLILNGSRLHKVWSGGGGWGIKKGLLALDPDSDYNCPEHEMQMGFGEDPIEDLAGAQLYRDVVKPGDIVSFFTPTPLEYPPASPRKPQDNLGSRTIRASHSAVFGALPSSTDAVPNSTSASGQTPLPFDHLLIRNHFGILSEHGMSINIHHHCFDDSGKFGAENPEVVVRTKLDAPYMLFSAEAPDTRPFLGKKKLDFRESVVEPPADTKDEGDRARGTLALMSDLARSLDPPQRDFTLNRPVRDRFLNLVKMMFTEKMFTLSTGRWIYNKTIPTNHLAQPLARSQPVKDEMIPIKYPLIRNLPFPPPPPDRVSHLELKTYSLSTGQWTRNLIRPMRGLAQSSALSQPVNDEMIPIKIPLFRNFPLTHPPPDPVSHFEEKMYTLSTGQWTYNQITPINHLAQSLARSQPVKDEMIPIKYPLITNLPVTHPPWDLVPRL